ncbi:MAG: metallophosphoesterase [Candidatus Latescibacterota bacterium]|nr:MAG: metallophosphoesterase [Candidatus Latescibacterota bacterium]
MRIAHTSDIHIDTSPRNREAAKAMAAAMGGLEPEVIVLAGDVGNTIGDLEKTLALFSELAVAKLFVPGNHDVWIERRNGTSLDSRTKYEKHIPEACREYGFHDLGQEPVIIGDTGFVGSLGWYDYSFADPRLGLTADDYWRGQYEDEIWWDKEMTFWPPPRATRTTPDKKRMRDQDLCAELCDCLKTDLEGIEDKVDRIVAVIHTLPFVETFPRSDPPYYLDAYTGSETLGNTLRANSKVTHCINGHKHTNGDWEIGTIRVHRRVLGSIDAGEDIGERARNAVGVIDLP